MKIAVGMPAFNAAAYIEQAIRSIHRESSCCDLAIVVIDDGSEDETWSILSAMTLDGLTISRQPNRGIATTRNAILPALMEADFATWVDADDLLAPGRLERDLNLLQGDPTLDFIYGSFQMFRENDPETLLPVGRTVSLRGVHLGAGLYRTSVLRCIGGFDESFEQAEDTDYLLRMFQSGARYIISDDIGYFYRQHESNITRNIAARRRGLTRAMLLAARRQKDSGPGAVLPKGIFDASELSGTMEW